jgi:hypothetical protein
MDAERWRQIELLYVAALECTPSVRPAFLKETCAGDEDLRRKVEALLARVEMYSKPPSMMSWDDYEGRATAEWQALLNSRQDCEQPRMHDFLAKHPSFVPGADAITESGRFTPCYWALFSKSPLREWDHTKSCYRDVAGLEIPDFMWLAHDSQNFTPVLIKIQSPRKQWFNNRGEPHDALIEALAHMAKWRTWLKRPESAIALYSSFDSSELHRCSFGPKYVLIYGREEEFQRRPDLDRLRSQFQQEDQIVMTFDQLKPARDCAGYVCASKGAERYQVVAVPPTMRLGPSIAGAWHRMHGFAEAIMANAWISLTGNSFSSYGYHTGRGGPFHRVVQTE